MSMPFGARVFYDRERRARLIANLDASLSKRRSGIHVSDLSLCLRQAAFRRLQPKPLTERDLSFFTAGRGHHHLVECIHGAEREVRREWNGVFATYDILEKTPIEFKTSRSFWRHVQPHWIRQLGYYCGIAGVSTGGLIVLWLFPNRLAREDGMIETYNVEFPDTDQIRQEICERRDIFLKALDANNPKLAPSVRTTDPQDGWLCRNCMYERECQGCG